MPPLPIRHSCPPREPRADPGATRGACTAVADDLTFAEAQEWLDGLEGWGVRSRVVVVNPTGRVSVWWAR